MISIKQPCDFYVYIFSKAAVSSICKEVDALMKICGKQKMLDAIRLPPPELYMRVEVCDKLILKRSYFNKF